jgi:hypothetical protein
MADHSLTDAAHDLLDHVQRFQAENGQKAKPLTRMRAGMLAEALMLEVDGKPDVPFCRTECVVCREAGL